jgi:hypothetical protein
VGVDVGLAAKILDQVDDDLDATRSGEFELLGPNAECDFREACVAQLGQLVAFEFQRRVTDLDPVRRDEPMNPATKALAGLS